MLNKKLFFTIVLLVPGILGTAFSQEKFIVDKVVANVGISPILYSEVVENAESLTARYRQQGYTPERPVFDESFEQILVTKLLYNQALVDSLAVNHNYVSQMVEEHVKNIVDAEGSISAVEKKYYQPIFDLRKDLTDKYTEMQLANSMQQTIIEPVTVTPGEVAHFYESLPADSLPMVPEQYMYAQITKYPSTTKEAEQRTRERLLEMRQRIVDGTKFELLARMYSQDPGSAPLGGELSPQESIGFATPFANALEKLRPGQISEIVQTEFGFHIIELIDKQGNLYHARHILLRPEFTTEEIADAGRFLDSLAREIRDGAITFEKAALEHSDDKFSKFNGGIVSNIEYLERAGYHDASASTRFIKEQLGQTNDLRPVTGLNPGEISHSYRSFDSWGRDLSKIVKLLEVIPTHPVNLNEDYLDVENMALRNKQSKELERWMEEKIKGMYIWIDPQFRDLQFENDNWIK